MDDRFNHKAAQWAHDVVMKMDDDTAVEFVRQVVHDTLHADIAANRRTLVRKVAEINRSIAADLNKVVSKSMGVEVAQSVVAEISKTWNEQTAWGGNPVRRDESGRFARVDRRGNKPLKGTQRAHLGVPEPRTASGRPIKLDRKARADFEHQYLQLVDVMDSFAARGIDEPTMVLEDKVTGKQRAVKITDGNPMRSWDPSRFDLVAVRGGGSGLGTASFDLVSSVAGPSAGARAGRAGDKVAEVAPSGKGFASFADRWNEAAQGDSSTNAPTYRRVQAGGKLLQDMAGGDDWAKMTPAQQKLYAAGKFAEYTGQFGPQAEQVIGPKMRQTAYRYRGTERTPDNKLLREHAAVLRSEQAQTPEQARFLAEREAVRYFLGDNSKGMKTKLPNLRLAEIQRKSGRIPPSEGVIIDKDGKIVTQAVGYAEDHYLPFNLKNLKALKGGSYVRTRSSGGLTTEDIYTGLVAGARSVTVVSNSGIFTLHFADDLRGGRRHSDKASSMVERYAKTLDAIKEGQIERQDLDAETKAAIREEVESKYEGATWKPPRAQIEEEIDEAIKEYKTSSALSEKELQLADARARNMARNEGDYRRVKAELIDELKDAKRSRYYRLDGEGYAAAMEALQEQYPYFIDTVNFAHRHETLSEGERSDKDSGLNRRFKAVTDSGYVKARHNRPDAVEEGYFDPEIAGEGERAGTGKTKASHTNYQNWAYNPTNPKAPRTRSQSGESANKPAQTTSTPGARTAVAAAASRKEYRDRMADVVQSVRTGVGVKPGEFPTFDEAVADFDAVFANEDKRAKLRSELEIIHESLAASEDAGAKSTAQRLQAKFQALNVAEGRAGGQEFSREQLGLRTKTPFSFSGAAYQPGATAAEHGKEMSRQVGILGRTMPSAAPRIADLDDAGLSSIAVALGTLSKAIGQGVDRALDSLAEVSVTLGADERWVDAQYRELQKMTEEQRTAKAAEYATAAEAVERIRRLKVVQPTPSEAPQVTATREADDEMDFYSAVGEIPGRLKEAARQMSQTNPRLSGLYNAVATHLESGSDEGMRRALSVAREAYKADTGEGSGVRQHMLGRIFPELLEDD